MDKLSPAIFESYGLTSRNIKKEKGHYFCETNKGLVRISITHETTEVIRLQHQIKEYIAASGFLFSDRFLLTTTNQPFSLIGRDTYVACLFSEAKAITPMPRETDFLNDNEVIFATQALARFHEAARNVPMENIIHAPPLHQSYAKQAAELAQAGKQTRRGSRLSDFDVAFIKYAPHFEDKIQTSIDILSSSNYQNFYIDALSQRNICHNALKEENLLIIDGETYITGFSYASVDFQLNDLAALIRRYAQRGNQTISINKLVDTYHDILKLPNGALEILYAQLIFPQPFLKIVASYYSKKRNWTPNGLLSRMDAIIRESEKYDEYVQSLIF